MLHLSTFLIRERVGLLKLVEVYDIFDPATGQQVGIARETLPVWVKLLRLFLGKHLAPTDVTVSASEAPGAEVFFTFHKPFSLFRARVTVMDAAGRELGVLVSKILTLGGGFHVYDLAGVKVAEVKGDWIGWNFTLSDVQGLSLGTITKKWAGIGKELFTSADNYVVQAEGAAVTDLNQKIILLALALATDMVFKEGRR